LIAEGPEVRLAPLYDLSSQLPYPELIRLRLAMKVGEHYDIGLIGAADWRAVAQACELDEAEVLKTAVDMAKSLPDEISATRDQALKEGLSKQIIAPLTKQLIEHAGERLTALTAHYSSKKRRTRQIAAK
jgi:serine/threonine-protein kinase HipA